MRARLTRIGGLRRDARGATALEFAILLPIFLAITFGIIQLGQAFWTQTALQHAVEMAARCATINTTTCGSTSQTQTYAATQAYGLTFPAGTFTATAAACGNQVTASYAFNVAMAAWFPATISLSARSCYPI